MDTNRKYKSFYLNEWDNDTTNPCDNCELSQECDRLADDFGIDYFMCLSTGVIKDVEYKKKHPKAYFKQVD